MENILRISLCLESLVFLINCLVVAVLIAFLQCVRDRGLSGVVF